MVGARVSGVADDLVTGLAGTTVDGVELVIGEGRQHQVVDGLAADPLGRVEELQLAEGDVVGGRVACLRLAVGAERPPQALDRLLDGGVQDRPVEQLEAMAQGDLQGLGALGACGTSSTLNSR